jgi:transposase-like protein
MPKQQRRTFTSEFKKQMVQLYENGKSRAAIVDQSFQYTSQVYNTRLKEFSIKGSHSRKATCLDNACIAVWQPLKIPFGQLFHALT